METPRPSTSRPATRASAGAPVIGIPCSTMDAEEGRGVRRMQVPEPYVRQVERAGGLPLLLPVADPARVPEYLPLVDAILFIGGDDVDPALYGASPHAKLGPVDRARDDFEIALMTAVRRDGIPALGICRGVQVMNVALGGTLHQHIPAAVPGALDHRSGYAARHEVALVPGCRLAAILEGSQVAANTSHHQSIDRLAKGLVATAKASDGVVEAAEAPDHPFLVGVQWHPERMDGDESTRRLFAAFVDAARSAKSRRATR